MASSSLSALTPDTRERAEAFLTAARSGGFDVSVGSTLRSCAEQGTSTAPFKVGELLLKRAAGCRSWHVWGRAFDIVLDGATKARYAELGALGKSFGLEWGGDFTTNYDPIHFQYPGGLSVQHLCPDPMDCKGAIEAAGRPLPEPGPSSPPKRAWDGRPAWFVVGVVVGWGIARWGRGLY